MKYVSGLSAGAVNSLRASICAAPITDATANAAKATHMCARTRRLIREFTADSTVRIGIPLVLADHPNHAPHTAVTEPAEFMTRYEPISRLRKGCADLRNVAGDYHRVDVRALDQHSVDDVGTRDAKAHFSPGRHGDAPGNESKLRRHHPRRDRAVGILDGAQVALD